MDRTFDQTDEANISLQGGRPVRRKPGKKVKKKKGIVKQAENLDQGRKVIVKNEVEMEGQTWEIEISSTENEKMSLLIAAFSKDTPESLLISLPKDRAEKIDQEFKSDYELMARSLQVNNHRLYLLNPSYVQQLEEEKSAADQTQENEGESKEESEEKSEEKKETSESAPKEESSSVSKPTE